MRHSWILILAGVICPTLASADPAKTPAATATLLNGRVEFTSPEGWAVAKSAQASETVAIYMADDKDGYLAIEVLPENAATTPAAAQKIVGQLRINHKKAGQEIVGTTTIEKDPRFDIKIHERYKTKEGKVADETHLYRVVAGRALELDVQSLSDDSTQIDAVQKAGEGMLLSAEWKNTKPKKK